MKYYKLDNDVFAFESDGSQDDYIKPEMVKMTQAQVDEHLKVEIPPLEQTLPPLTRRQFKLALLYENLTDDVEAAIEGIQDTLTKEGVRIEYTEGTKFHRTSDSIQYLASVLDISTEELNTIWEKAVNY